MRFRVVAAVAAVVVAIVVGAAAPVGAHGGGPDDAAEVVGREVSIARQGGVALVRERITLENRSPWVGGATVRVPLAAGATITSAVLEQDGVRVASQVLPRAAADERFDELRQVGPGVTRTIAIVTMDGATPEAQVALLAPGARVVLEIDSLAPLVTWTTTTSSPCRARPGPA